MSDTDRIDDGAADQLDARDGSVTVGAEQPADAAEEWAAAHRDQRPRPVRAGSTPLRPLYPADDDSQDIDDAGVNRDHDAQFADDEPLTARLSSLDVADEHREQRRLIPDEVDRAEWTGHVAAAPAGAYEVQDVELRPVPRRPGRGGFDPEAAEATRAYHYQQRRRVALILLIATAAFTVASWILASWLWVGAFISAALLVGYLAYLRRQVKIEAGIRQRRMERLQRARQIRPEYQRPPRRTRGGLSAVAPGRAVVDLDDDDPSFDELENYREPVTYRRAAGQ